MTVWQRLSKGVAFLTNRAIRSQTVPFINKLEVKSPSLEQHVGNLSGGNQQKVSVAKWLAAGVNILIIDEPSVGIDIKTKAYLHELIRELSDEGTAILLITSDMPEMITLADRIVVMNDYLVMGELPNTRDYTEMSEGIMQLIHDAEETAESFVQVTS
jgi:ribose transport system ATP-binding protein